MTKKEKQAYYESGGLYDVVEHGNYFIAKYKVIFGVRIRGGLIGDIWHDIDLCCGSEPYFIIAMHSLYSAILEKNIAEGLPPMTNLPPRTNIKPAFKDQFFLDWLTGLNKQLGEDYGLVHKSKE